MRSIDQRPQFLRKFEEGDGSQKRIRPGNLDLVEIGWMEARVEVSAPPAPKKQPAPPAAQKVEPVTAPQPNADPFADFSWAAVRTARPPKSLRPKKPKKGGDDGGIGAHRETQLVPVLR